MSIWYLKLSRCLSVCLYQNRGSQSNNQFYKKSRNLFKYCGNIFCPCPYTWYQKNFLTSGLIYGSPLQGSFFIGPEKVVVKKRVKMVGQPYPNSLQGAQMLLDKIVKIFYLPPFLALLFYQHNIVVSKICIIKMLYI